MYNLYIGCFKIWFSSLNNVLQTTIYNTEQNKRPFRLGKSLRNKRKSTLIIHRQTLNRLQRGIYTDFFKLILKRFSNLFYVLGFIFVTGMNIILKNQKSPNISTLFDFCCYFSFFDHVTIIILHWKMWSFYSYGT